MAAARVPGIGPDGPGWRRAHLAGQLTLERPIQGFHRDDEGHFVAELSCGHTQHLRHDPPFVVREWVLDPDEREARLGSLLACPGCERGEIPDGYSPASRTPEFDQDSIPDALKRDHDTKPGVWGVIHVSEGRLAYRVCPPLESRREIAAGGTAVVVPEVLHSVEALGPVRFHVEFLRRS